MCSLKQTVQSSGLGGMESAEVKNVDEEAAFLVLLDCDGSCLGLGSRALAPALPSFLWASDFAICPFLLSLPGL